MIQAANKTMLKAVEVKKMKKKALFCVFLMAAALSVFCSAALATDYGMPPVIINGAGNQPSVQAGQGIVNLTKSPTGEIVDEYGSAIFIARADNATSISWRFVSPDTTVTYTDTEALSAFPGLSIEGLGTERVKLWNIPYAMNGWKVQAKFEGYGGPVLSSGAPITVNPAQIVYVTATPAPTPAPTPVPTAAPTPAPVQTPVPTWAPAAPEGTMPPVVTRTADPQDSSLLPVPTPLPTPVLAPAATPAPQNQVLGVTAKDLIPLVIGAVLIAAMIIGTTVYLVKTKPE